MYKEQDEDGENGGKAISLGVAALVGCGGGGIQPVSYTPLPLPTLDSVYISVVAVSFTTNSLEYIEGRH